MSNATVIILLMVLMLNYQLVSAQDDDDGESNGDATTPETQDAVADESAPAAPDDDEGESNGDDTPTEANENVAAQDDDDVSNGIETTTETEDTFTGVGALIQMRSVAFADGATGPGALEYFNVAYNYTEPKVWALTYPACAGIQQSPVEIDPALAKPYPSKERLFWISYDEDPDIMTVTNDGNLVTISGVWRGWPHIAGSILRGSYKFVEMRFHWGLSPIKGSEHLIKNQKASMELQFVHYKSDYEYLENALSFPDGVAIVSRFFVASKTAKNTYFDELGEILMNITTPGSDIDFGGFALDRLNPPFKTYYTYLGSLTQPPCSESVIWIVCPEILQIPSSIWELFITLQSKTDGVMGDNFRAPQELNSRVITKII